MEAPSNISDHYYFGERKIPFADSVLEKTADDTLIR